MSGWEKNDRDKGSDTREPGKPYYDWSFNFNKWREMFDNKHFVKKIMGLKCTVVEIMRVNETNRIQEIYKPDFISSSGEKWPPYYALTDSLFGMKDLSGLPTVIAMHAQVSFVDPRKKIDISINVNFHLSSCDFKKNISHYFRYDIDQVRAENIQRTLKKEGYYL